VIEFSRQDFEQKRALFEELENGQSPETLLITCADSRIDPNLITRAQPGELFICRNAGNIVPSYSPHTGGISASIEYAVSVLGVNHIIVCGHTDCGAMKGAMAPESLAALPQVSSWLGYCDSALARVKAKHGSACKEHLLDMTEENVVLQMKHLETHPSVASRLARKDIEIHGWVYHIGSGTVYCHDTASQRFIPLEERYDNLLSKAV
jgi:carbonic anhydrase